MAVLYSISPAYVDTVLLSPCVNVPFRNIVHSTHFALGAKAPYGPQNHRGFHKAGRMGHFASTAKQGSRLKKQYPPPAGCRIDTLPPPPTLYQVVADTTLGQAEGRACA